MSTYNQEFEKKKANRIRWFTYLTILFTTLGVYVAMSVAKPVLVFPILFVAAVIFAVAHRAFDRSLNVTILESGRGGRVAKPGDTLSVHYSGSILGKDELFDSSFKRGKPIQFTLGAGQVIKGWDMGLKGMQEGEKRRLIIPPALAYGNKGAGDKIPPNSRLDFEVELLSIKDG